MTGMRRGARANECDDITHPDDRAQTYALGEPNAGDLDEYELTLPAQERHGVRGANGAALRDTQGAVIGRVIIEDVTEKKAWNAAAPDEGS